MLSIQLLVISGWDRKAAFGFKNVAPVVPYPGPPLHADTKFGGYLPESRRIERVGESLANGRTWAQNSLRRKKAVERP